MSKPIYQRILQSYLPWILFGITSIASIFDSLGKLSFISPLLTYFGTIFTLTALALINYVLKKYPVNWKIESGETIRVKSLGFKAYFIALGIIISLWLPRFFSINQPPSPTTQFTPPPITIVPPTVVVIIPHNSNSTMLSDFKPIVEEFETSQDFTQTSQNITFDRGRVVWYFNRNRGDQYVYKKIPTIEANSNLRFTVTGQIDSWTSNCRAGAGIGNKVGEGLAIYFGYYGGGCSQQGANISAGGINVHFREDDCEFLGQWPWIRPSIPYRASLEINGTSATLLVEDVAKVFATSDYNQEYSILWIGNTGYGDWPECTGVIESVTIEPLLDK